MAADPQHKIRWFVYAAPGELIPREASMRGSWPCEAKCSCGWETKTGGGVKPWIAGLIRDHKWDVAHGFWTPEEQA